MQTAEPADSDQSFWDVLQGRRQKRFEESEMFQRLGKYELEKRIPVLEIVAIKKKVQISAFAQCAFVHTNFNTAALLIVQHEN